MDMFIKCIENTPISEIAYVSDGWGRKNDSFDMSNLFSFITIRWWISSVAALSIMVILLGSIRVSGNLWPSIVFMESWILIQFLPLKAVA